MDIQKAWDADDRIRLRGLVGPDLMTEWERRLDDFAERAGATTWSRSASPRSSTSVSPTAVTVTATAWSSGSTPASGTTSSTDSGGRLKRSGAMSDVDAAARVLDARASRRPLGAGISIELGAEGKHALNDRSSRTAWSDERGMRDEALIEGAVADAVPTGTKVAEVADLQFDGDAHAAANDLSLADGRFAPDVLAVAARRAVDAWARAIDGSDAALNAIATPQAKRELLYAGDTSGTVRVVVRGPNVNRIRIVALDANAEPATMTVEVDLTGKRYVENRDTTAVLAGSRTRQTSFTERWTTGLTGDQAQPWRITAVTAPVGLV